MRVRIMAAGLVTGLALSTATAGTASAEPAVPAPALVTPYVSFAAAFAASVLDPAASPPGVNVPGCRLTADHPRPVLLVNGTFETMLSSFGYLGPRLANAGYCVYGYNYGGDPASPVQSLAPVADNLATLAAQVRKVKRQTGAARVDLVGFSQGGLLAEIYTKFDGAANVNSVTALAPTTHGTTLLGIGTLGSAIPGALPLLRAGGCPACADQVRGSDVVTRLNSGPVAVPGVSYRVIETRYEDVVTPVGSSFIREPGVVNQYVQSFDPTDLSEHLALPFSPVAARLTLTALRVAG